MYCGMRLGMHVVAICSVLAAVLHAKGEAAIGVGAAAVGSNRPAV